MTTRRPSFAVGPPPLAAQTNRGRGWADTGNRAERAVRTQPKVRFPTSWPLICRDGNGRIGPDPGHSHGDYRTAGFDPKGPLGSCHGVGRYCPIADSLSAHG